MGGEWGVGASLALESASPRLRGLLSGLLQEGYALGNLLSAVAFRTVYPYFNAHYPGNGWRVMFFVGGLPALLSLFIRSRVKESEAWAENRTDWTTYRRSLLQHGRRFLYLVLLMTMMNFLSHGTQDMYPTLLKNFGFVPTEVADITVLSMIGAILGGLAFGFYSDRGGRRRAMLIAMVCALAVIPFWLAGHSTARILIGVFLMQFFVQGAWGVIPAHLNELSPGPVRATLPAFVYQAGNFLASYNGPFQAKLAESPGASYGYALALVAGIVAVAIVVVIRFSPERRGEVLSVAH
jgi:SHS family lactate transporter-like MFS transporter